MNNYVIGIDYGTNSCRAVLMEIGSTDEIATSVFPYPSGEAGILTDKNDPHVARQHPQDYVDGLVTNIQNVLADAKNSISGFEASQVKALGFATTGSTIIPVDQNNKPLAFHDEFKDNLNAMSWLWKDHTSIAEANQVTELASQIRPEYLERCGGTYSSEWFWAKILHLKNIDSVTFNAAHSYIELCDFLPAVLAGVSNPKEVKRGICAAAHKAMYCDKWGGLPDKEFLSQLAPELADLRDRLYEKAYASDEIAGKVSAKWAEETGLAEGTVLAVGAFDAHLGAVGAGIGEGTLVKIMGTSTCDLMISQQDAVVKGVCGVAQDSVIPGYTGIEAGQSAVGDLFLWLVNNLVPDSYGASLNEKFKNLTEEASKQKPGQSGLLALDWNNGNRSILVDMNLSGLMIGQTLHTKAHEVYRALIEATAFGALKIINRLEESGTQVKDVVCCGGLANKNDMMMQIYADVTGRPIKIAPTEQTCAVGAAISAASAFIPDSMTSCKEKMTVQPDKVFTPTDEGKEIYARLFKLYDELHDSFGVKDSGIDLYHVMKELNALRKEVCYA